MNPKLTATLSYIATILTPIFLLGLGLRLRSATDLGQGYVQFAAEGSCGGDKGKEGKCGEGKCGADKKEGEKGAEGKCGGDKKEG